MILFFHVWCVIIFIMCIVYGTVRAKLQTNIFNKLNTTQNGSPCAAVAHSQWHLPWVNRSMTTAMQARPIRENQQAKCRDETKKRPYNWTTSCQSQ